MQTSWRYKCQTSRTSSTKSKPRIVNWRQICEPYLSAAAINTTQSQTSTQTPAISKEHLITVTSTVTTLHHHQLGAMVPLLKMLLPCTLGVPTSPVQRWISEHAVTVQVKNMYSTVYSYAHPYVTLIISIITECYYPTTSKWNQEMRSHFQISPNTISPSSSQSCSTSDALQIGM